MTAGVSADEGPATFRSVLAHREYRYLLSANVFSWIGDYLARAAVTVLVLHHSGSVALSAASFALSYLPWLVGGPVPAAVAERMPFRSTMVACDLIRMLLIGLIALPGMPIWGGVAAVLRHRDGGPTISRRPARRSCRRCWSATGW